MRDQEPAELAKVPVHLHMTEECQNMYKLEYSAMEDTVTRQVFEEVHHRVKCRHMADQEYKHMPVGFSVYMMDSFELADWETNVTKWDVFPQVCSNREKQWMHS